MLFVGGEHADDGEGDQKSGDHGLRMMCGVLPLDCCKFTAPLVDPSIGMWWGSRKVLVRVR